MGGLEEQAKRAEVSPGVTQPVAKTAPGQTLTGSSPR